MNVPFHRSSGLWVHLFYGPTVGVTSPRCDAGCVRAVISLKSKLHYWHSWPQVEQWPGTTETHTHVHTHTLTRTLRQPQAWQIRVRVNSGDIMQTHGCSVEKHSPFTKSFFSSPNGEDKLSKLAPQILTGRNWWSPARCQCRGAPKHTLVRFRGFALIYFRYLFV